MTSTSTITQLPQPSLSSSSLAPLNQITPYNPSEYIQTANTLNRVSRKAVILGTQNIILSGKCIIHHNAFLRGDLARHSGTTTGKNHQAATGHNVVIITGRYCVFGVNSLIRPPYKTYKGTFSYYPLKMDNFVHIGSDTIFQASSVGAHVSIGRNCVIGKFVTIKECVVILDDSVIPPQTTVQSGQIWAGNPARCIGELQESWSEEWENRCREYYAKFRPAT
ncbi:unnamed protein product [Sympodiomycopsis kandeliae]